VAKPVEASCASRELSLARRKRYPSSCKAHVAPPVTTRPALFEEVPLLIRLEREVEDEFRPQMCARLQERLNAEGAKFAASGPPRCARCGGSAESRGKKRSSFITRFGKVWVRTSAYLCKPCKWRQRPFLQHLGVEVGRISGSLARLVALVGVVVPYPLASHLVELFFGVKVSPMSVWRCVQRLGEACEQHTLALAEFHKDPNHLVEAADGPAAVVLGVDGCALGMQVRKNRRRRPIDGKPLPALPKVEEGHFREVKTGALLLPAERVETSPGRHSVVRRALVTCLGNADLVFDLLWSKLQELKWLGSQTIVVIVGDGAEWIWKRAEMFVSRCEILDFWHAVEKAWELARLRYGEESKRANTWMARLAADLRAGKVLAVIARLQKLKTTSPEEQEKLEGLIRYYTDNAERMRYDEYLRKGYGIGSGAVESAHKQVVHARLRQAGMRWSEAGARRLLALRVLLLNGQWGQLDHMAMKHIAA